MVQVHEAKIWPHVAKELRELSDRGPAAGVSDPETGQGGRSANSDPFGLVSESDGRLNGQPYGVVFHLALINLTGFALLAAAYHLGWIDKILAADATGMCIAIFLVVLAGLAACGRKVWMISRELNCIWKGELCPRSWAFVYLSEVRGRSAGSRAISASALKMKIANGIVIVRYIANSLVLLGLIGTVLGFIIAFGAVDPSSAGDVHAIEPMVTQLISGMSVALFTTLVGSVLNLWLTVNHRLLASGSVKLATELIALGEANARSGHD